MSSLTTSPFLSVSARPRRRARVLLAVTLVLVAAAALGFWAVRAQAASPSWQWTPVSAPAPPDGTAPSPFPVALGQVGQISFWAPNRGLLITGGTTNAFGSNGGGIVSPGLYAYDGVSWHQLSTVCGSSQGRIAWAGPDEFWTISDQRAASTTGMTGSLTALSLCHFLNGQVVGSYAVPTGQGAASYQPMYAASCTSPSDCWFGGDDIPDAAPGAFQLHWDGAEVTELKEPEQHPVRSSVTYQGQVYEGVEIDANSYEPGEDTQHPAVLHRTGTDASNSFGDVFTYGQGQVLPDYTDGVTPDALGPFSLGTDAGPLGTSGGSTLWAAANPASTPTGSNPASLTILKHVRSGWSQITPTPSNAPAPSCQSTLPAGSELASVSAGTATIAVAPAPVPGTGDVWLSMNRYLPGGVDKGVELVRLDGNGCLTETDDDFPQQPGQSSAPGGTGPVTCLSADDCWMVTSAGWLYHYTDGTQQPQDADPNFAGVITFRPSDAGTPTTFGDVDPTDTSLLYQQPAPTGTAKTTGKKQNARTIALVTSVKSKLRHTTRRHRTLYTLVLTFKLHARARIQIIASRHHKVVARSARKVFAAGKRSLSLRLDPKRYPTGIRIVAKRVPSK